MSINDADVEKIINKLKPWKKPRWYDEPEKVKKWAPIVTACAYGFGLAFVYTILIAGALLYSNVTLSGDDLPDTKFRNIAIEVMDCDSLRAVSLELMKQDVSSPAFSNMRSNIDSQILARCLH